ncbi:MULTISPECIES: TetR/AcrR family transcriptional regulator [unclassified Aureimonas]|uniref:TetR/AcrR family transcriptional regulator n=1 Tax=unclassified Aureimonas TaxID=2615206 RepID=UPI00072156C1|nr:MULTISPECIES: TetR/AcrR family transcriptional regulator [unclassified Aureimonas]ALN72019.1 hypothetical protein M673_04780 [Aureimonas sp. AU20]
MSTLSAVPPQDDLAAAPTRKDHILGAARICFSRSGFHRASMSEICAEAKMSPGALYRYYPSKDAIIEAIAEEERVAAGACLAGLEGPGPVVDRITEAALAYLTGACDPETGNLIVEICSESLRNTAVGARFQMVEDEARSRIRQALKGAQDQGEIPGDLDLELALTLLMSIGDGLVMRLRLEPERPLETLRPYLHRMIASLLGASQA